MARLERFFADLEDETDRVFIHAIRFWVAFAAGRMQEAHDETLVHAQAHPDEGRDIYPDAAICALLNRDADLAAEALASLDATGVHGRVVSMHRRTIQSGRAALDGRAAEALAGFREALAGWRDLGLPWRIALTAIVMATVLGPQEPEVRAAADEAREILDRLGAKPFLERLDTLMARSETPASSSPAT
jgi:hypothetical protein